MKFVALLLGIVLTLILISQWTDHCAPADNAQSNIIGGIETGAAAISPAPPADTPVSNQGSADDNALNPFSIVLLAVGLTGLFIGHTRRI